VRPCPSLGKARGLSCKSSFTGLRLLLWRHFFKDHHAWVGRKESVPRRIRTDLLLIPASQYRCVSIPSAITFTP